MKRALLFIFFTLVCMSITHAADSQYGVLINGTMFVAGTESGTDTQGRMQYLASPQLSVGDLVEIVDTGNNNGRWMPAVEQYGAYTNFTMLSDTALLCNVEGCYDFYIKLSAATTDGLYIGDGSNACTQGVYYYVYDINPTGNGGTTEPTDYVDTGTLANGQVWQLTADGILTIIGDGTIADFSSSTAAPWYQYVSTIVTVILNGEYTSIGKYVFYNHSSLTKVVCTSSSVPTLASSTFSTNQLTKITALVPAEAVSMYQAAQYWKQMTIEANPDSGNEGTTTEATCYLLGNTEELGAWNLANALPMPDGTITLQLPAGTYSFKVLPQNTTWDGAMGFSALRSGCSEHITNDTDDNIIVTLADGALLFVQAIDRQLCVTGQSALPEVESTSNYAILINHERMVVTEYAGYNWPTAEYMASVQLDKGDTVRVINRAGGNASITAQLEEYGAYEQFQVDHDGYGYAYDYFVTLTAGCYDFYYKQEFSQQSYASTGWTDKLYIGNGSTNIGSTCSLGETYTGQIPATAQVQVSVTNEYENGQGYALINGYGDYNTTGPSVTYVIGSNIEIQAKPNSGYVFTEWSDGSYENPRYMQVIGDVSIAMTCTSANLLPLGILVNGGRFVRSSKHETLTGNQAQVIVHANVEAGDVIQVLNIETNDLLSPELEPYGDYQLFTLNADSGSFTCANSGCFDFYLKMNAGELQTMYVQAGTTCYDGVEYTGGSGTSSYYLVGSSEYLGEWNAESAFKMTNDSIRLTLPAGDYEFKILTQRNSWANCMGYSSLNSDCSSQGVMQDAAGNDNIRFILAEAGDVIVHVNGGLICVTGNFGDTTSTTNTYTLSFSSDWTFIMLPGIFVDDTLPTDYIQADGELQWATYNGELRAASISGWQMYDAANGFLGTQAYIVRSVGDTATLTITIPEQESVQQELSMACNYYESVHAQNANWNFIGNLYSKPYNIMDALVAQGIEAPITVWNGTGYSTYTPGIDEYTLQPFEAFFIQLPDNGPETITFSSEYFAVTDGATTASYMFDVDHQDGWTNTASMLSGYWLLDNDKVLTSPEVDLAKLSSIHVRMRTYGGTQYSQLQVTAGNNVLAIIEASKGSTMTDYEWTSTNTLTGKLPITFTCLNAGNQKGIGFESVTIEASGVGDDTSDAIAGALPGKFSVSATKQVQFSQGNLQYQASTNTWRFAENQYDVIGGANANISETYEGWIDLFGWGTGNNPTNTSTTSEDYSTFFDWGNNAISNGGNIGYSWRTLSYSEWVYLFEGRTNALSLYGLATVNGINGIIILPDEWDASQNISFASGTSNGFSQNSFTLTQWIAMETNGAVFLPMAGRRIELTYYNENELGLFWSSSVSSTENRSYAIMVNASGVNLLNDDGWTTAVSVRLVR